MRWNDLTEEQKYAYWSDLMGNDGMTHVMVAAYPYGWYASVSDRDNPRVYL